MAVLEFDIIKGGKTFHVKVKNQTIDNEENTLQVCLNYDDAGLDGDDNIAKTVFFSGTNLNAAFVTLGTQTQANAGEFISNLNELVEQLCKDKWAD